MAQTKKSLQREVIEEAFNQLGGINRLIEWCNQPDDKGNMTNYKEFIKLYVKLAPPLKTETDKNKDTQEGFIMSLIKADNILKLNSGKPKQLIDVEAETQ
jgi:hypothetical protein